VTTDDAASRAQREQEFHDERFADPDHDRPAGRFYKVATGIEQFYEDRVARIEPGQRTLELGCGLLAESWKLAERGVDVVSIDISAVAIEHMRNVADERGVSGHITFEHMNAEELAFPDESFDVVIGNGILHHLDLDRALTGIHRVLRPGGWAAFREPLGHNPFVNGYRKLTPNQRTDDEHPLLVGDLDTIDRYFPGSDHEYFNLTDLLSIGVLNSSRFESVRSSLAKVDQKLFAKVPALRRYGWMVGVEVHKAA
jgi:2-polyprenyl-3-methyl-5-hydroxy-6-metoxy-1,4-benzoquinol methylase